MEKAVVLGLGVNKASASEALSGGLVWAGAGGRLQQQQPMHGADPLLLCLRGLACRPSHLQGTEHPPLDIACSSRLPLPLTL